MSGLVGFDIGQVVNELQNLSRLTAAIQQAIDAASVDLGTINTTIAVGNTILSTINTTLGGGLVIVNTWPAYLVANLPTGVGVPTFAYATDGRKPGEGGGSGTGVPVWYDVSAVWFSFCSGAAVTS